MSSHCLNDHISIVIHPKYNENSVHCQTWGRERGERIGKREEVREAQMPPLEGRWHAQRDGEVCRPKGGGASAPSAQAGTPLHRPEPSGKPFVRQHLSGASRQLPSRGAFPLRHPALRTGGKIRHCRQLSLTLAGENCKIYAESSMARLRLGNRNGLSFQIETP